MARGRTLRLPAIEINQGDGRLLYSFAVDGKRLKEFAGVSQARRDDHLEIQGYQRPEVLAHVAEIKSYLESDQAFLPNSLVVAFDNRVKFVTRGRPRVEPPYSRVGDIVIPLGSGSNGFAKPGWIVDGQQRAAALRDADVSGFPVAVNAFIAASSEEQREQFILVNSVKPLSRALIYELLPFTDAKLPKKFEARRLPAFLLQRLNYDADSPLCSLIKTSTNPIGVIQDNSILRMIEHSLTDGVLYPFRHAGTDEVDSESMLRVLKSFWTAVETVFSEAWALPPRRSRLMHGAGVVTLGFLMDDIADSIEGASSPTIEEFQEELSRIELDCHWTRGEWRFASDDIRPWNGVQNTSKDVRLLTDHLLGAYREAIGRLPT